jgi:hypothetical protein
MVYFKGTQRICEVKILNLKTKLALTSFLVVGVFWFTNTIHSGADAVSPTSQPGSVDDPVITKSYFDQNVKQKIADEISKLKQEPSTSKPTPNENSTPSPSSPSLTVVKLEQGQILYAGAGTEFIVRTGKTVAVSTDENGIPDVTSGKDIASGSPIELNHLLVFPKEGRGIKPDPKQKVEIFVMIRGSYLVLNSP